MLELSQQQPLLPLPLPLLECISYDVNRNSNRQKDAASWAHGYFLDPERPKSKKANTNATINRQTTGRQADRETEESDRQRDTESDRQSGKQAVS